MNKYEQAIEILKKYNQEHVITILKKLEKDKKEILINQILLIDFEELEELHESIYEDQYSNLGKIEPIEALNIEDLPKEEIDKYINMGINIVKNNKFAVATMAGRTRNKASDIMDQKVLIR